MIFSSKPPVQVRDQFKNLCIYWDGCGVCVVRSEQWRIIPILRGYRNGFIDLVLLPTSLSCLLPYDQRTPTEQLSPVLKVEKSLTMVFKSAYHTIWSILSWSVSRWDFWPDIPNTRNLPSGLQLVMPLQQQKQHTGARKWMNDRTKISLIFLTFHLLSQCVHHAFCLSSSPVLLASPANRPTLPKCCTIWKNITGSKTWECSCRDGLPAGKSCYNLDTVDKCSASCFRGSDGCVQWQSLSCPLLR